VVEEGGANIDSWLGEKLRSLSLLTTATDTEQDNAGKTTLLYRLKVGSSGPDKPMRELNTEVADR